MEYEKKYNDLIARINAVKNTPKIGMKGKHHYDGYVESGIRDALDYILNPESEDEKFARIVLDLPFKHEADYKFVRAYLEKQKEQKDYNKRYEDIAKSEWFKKAYEGKSLGCDYEQAEEEPVEWSEEDERIKDNLLSELFNLYVGAQIKESTYFKYKDFIKNSIPKIKQLTVEQKSAISRAIFLAKSAGEESLARTLNTIYNETNVVQPHWKPSEEQMRCLLDCVSKAKEIHNASVGGYDAYRILVSLYDELYKLL